ncbi:MAG: sodium-dependent bicarbonate transport family permease, partial [Usitatibacteraceae bacterium]
MPGIDLLITNLLSPIVLAFVLGIIAGVIKSELELPEPVLKLLAIYLLFSIGLKGGTELAAVSFADIAGVLGVTIALTIAIPIVAYFVLRKLGNLSISNAAAVAAHYGSVSSVTF